MYELGDLVHSAVYREWQPFNAKGWTAEMKIAVADMLAQIIILCEREGFDFEELKQFGIARCIEKTERYRQ